VWIGNRHSIAWGIWFESVWNCRTDAGVRLE
jgi:hypothetical protein